MNGTSSYCAKCGKNADLVCINCKNIFYCSRECQKNDWKIHKIKCRPFEVESDEKIGRYLTANRQIQAGSVIISESPLVVGPKWTSDDNEDENFINFQCVGCFETIKLLRHKCESCLWPSCSPDCQGLTNSELHGIECQLLKLGNGPQNRSDIKCIKNYFRMDVLLAMKILVLQRRNSKKFKAIMEMESNEKKRVLTENYKEAEEKIIYIVDNFLKPLEKAEEKNGQIALPLKDKKILHKIYGILETNGMYITLNTGTEISGIYQTGVLIEHSCLPNIGYQFDMKNGFKMSMKAARNIKSGEHLSISYSSLLWPTVVRQQQLSESKYFTCTCVRCSDPTELGTHFSTLRCIGSEENPCNGLQLPTAPTSEKDNEFACNKCPMKVSQEHVLFITGKMNEEVDKILAHEPNPEVLEELIEKLSPFLHQNHYLFFNLKHTLIQLYGNHKNFSYSSMSDSIFQRKLFMCNELLKIVNAFDPFGMRIAFYISIIYYEKAICLLEMRKRNMENVELNDAKTCLENAKRIILTEQEMNEGKLLLQKIENALI